MKLFNTLIVIILLSLFGCNSLNDYQLIERGETVTIDYENSRADEAGRISNQAIATDTGTGVATGAIVGAAWGLTCGPFFWLCSPLGALAGATTGATAGFVVGVLESLPEEKVHALSDQITGYLALQDPQQQFHAALLNRTAGEWHVVAQAADKNLEISLENLSLRTHRQEQVTLVMDIAVELSYTDSSDRSVMKRRRLEYESSPRFAQSWLDNQDNLVQREFEAAYNELAEQIFVVFARQTEK